MSETSSNFVPFPTHSTSTGKSGNKTPRRRSSAAGMTKNSININGQTLPRDINSKITFILSQLSTEELETAARSCYEYLKHPIQSRRNFFARRIVQRYLESRKGKVEPALEKLKRTLKFRNDFAIDALITAFDGDEDLDDDSSKSEVAETLLKHLSTKKYFVQGFDKEGRSTLFFIPRLVNGHDIEWTIKEAIYSIERAVACSRAKDHTINAVVDFSGFSMTQHSPPLEIGKQFLMTLRSHYAGQIHRIYLTDYPFGFSILWKIFSPLIGTDTREKIKFANGTLCKERELLNAYDIQELPAWLVTGGKKNRPIDLYEYLHEIPFDQPFDVDNGMYQ